MKQIIILAGLFVTGCFINSTARPAIWLYSDSSRYEQQLERGIQAFYQSDWKQASSAFQQLQQEYPDDARAFFFDSMIPFWKYYFGGKENSAASAFLERSQKAISVSHDQLRANPHDTTMVLMLSGLYGYRSLVAAEEGEYRTAIQSGMTGFKYTRQLLALDADDPRALIGKGMFYYMVGSVPSGLKWVTNLAGMSGDVEEGFRALEQAARSESYVSNDAKMMLAFLYERESREQKSLKHLQDLSAKYPQNIIFQYHTARLLEKCGEKKKARQKFKLVSLMENETMPLLKEKSKSHLGKL